MTRNFEITIKTVTVLLIPLLISACGTNESYQSHQSHQSNELHQSNKSSENGMGWTSSNPVEPHAGEWKAIVMKDGKQFKLEAPPANDSAGTKAELEELHQVTKNRTKEDIELIHYWSGATVSPYQRWFEITEKMIKKYNLSPPAASRVHALLSNAVFTASTATYDQKYHYLRPRPTDLDPTIALPEGFNVPAHPSYPSGHSATGAAASGVLSHIFPHEAATFEKMLVDCSTSRLKAGIHFKSDIVAGEKLGKDVATDIIEEAKKDKTAPIQYTETGHGPSGH